MTFFFSRRKTWIARSHHIKLNCYSLSTSIASNKKAHKGNEIRLTLGCNSYIFVEDSNISFLQSPGLERTWRASQMNWYSSAASNAPTWFFLGSFLCVRNRAKLTINTISNLFFIQIRDVTAKDMQTQREIIFL